MQLLDHPHGNYQFLTGIAPYSAGVVAQPGYTLVRATLHTPLPYVQGLSLIDRHLAGIGRPNQALCAVELRLPQPLSFQGFTDFNVGYRAQLAQRNLLVGEFNPIARTNVAPQVQPPPEPALYAFSYTIPTGPTPASFVVAGAGDLRDQAVLDPAAVVRPGETTPAALAEKVTTVLAVMEARLTGLGRSWAQVTAVDLYTIYDMLNAADAGNLSAILTRIGVAASQGVHWFYSHPPIADLAFEMDLRGVHYEIRL